MTDIKSTIAELRYLADWAQHHLDKAKIANDAADAIEALQGENERLKDLELTWRICHERSSDAARDLANERDALQAKLDELQRQEPVALDIVNRLILVKELQAKDLGSYSYPHGQGMAYRCNNCDVVSIDDDCIPHKAGCITLLAHEAPHVKLSELHSLRANLYAAPKALEPLTDKQIAHLWAFTWTGDRVALARAIEAAIVAKLASAELPEPYGWAKQSEIEQHARFGGSINLWRKQYDNDTTFFTADQLRQAYAQGAAAQLAEKPVCWMQNTNAGLYMDYNKSEYNTVPLYTRRQA